MKDEVKKIIQWTGKATGIDVAYYLKGGFWLSLTYMSSALLGLLIVIAFANLLPKSIYGEYQFFLSIMAIVVIFSLPGMNQAIIRAVARGEKSSVFAGTSAKLRWSFLGSLALLAVSGYMLLIGHPSWPHYIFAAATFPFVNAFTTFYSYLYGSQRFADITRYNFAVQSVITAAIIGAILLSGEILFIILAYLIAPTITQYYFFRRVTSKIPKRGKNDVVSYGKHLSLVEGLAMIAEQADKLLLSYFAGFVAVASYTIATILPQQVAYQMKLLPVLILPKFSRKSNIRAIVRSKILLVIGLSVVIGIVGFLVSPILIPLLFSSQYADVIFFAQLLFLGSIALIPSQIIFTLLIAQKKVRKIHIFNIFSSGSRLILVAVLVPLAGILGAVIAVVTWQYLRLLVGLALTIWD